MAGAALTAVLALCSGAFGQNKPQEGKTYEQGITVKVRKAADKSEQGGISGVVVDNSGAVVPEARITLINTQTEEEVKTVSTDEGVFKFSNVVTGTYSLKIEAPALTYILDNLKVNSDEIVQATINLELGGGTEMLGTYVLDTEIEPPNIIDGMVQNLLVPK
jgi:RNase P/RNase MRP subunit p29